MTNKCEKCGKGMWGERGVYLVGHAYVAQLCVSCEQRFQDLPWIDPDLTEYDIVGVQLQRASTAVDFPEVRLRGLFERHREMKMELRAKCKAWLAEKIEPTAE